MFRIYKKIFKNGCPSFIYHLHPINSPHGVETARKKLPVIVEMSLIVDLYGIYTGNKKIPSCRRDLVFLESRNGEI